LTSLPKMKITLPGTMMSIRASVVERNCNMVKSCRESHRDRIVPASDFGILSREVFNLSSIT